MVNIKECYKILSNKIGEKGRSSKTISMRLPSDFPLKGYDVKILLEEHDLREHSEEYTIVNKSLINYMKDKRNGFTSEGN